MTRLHVKPAEGRAAPDPGNNYALLPAEGGFVPDNAYWQRRLKDQDVIKIEAPGRTGAGRGHNQGHARGKSQ